MKRFGVSTVKCDKVSESTPKYNEVDPCYLKWKSTLLVPRSSDISVVAWPSLYLSRGMKTNATFASPSTEICIRGGQLDVDIVRVEWPSILKRLLFSPILIWLPTPSLPSSMSILLRTDNWIWENENLAEKISTCLRSQCQFYLDHESNLVFRSDQRSNRRCFVVIVEGKFICPSLHFLLLQSIFKQMLLMLF